MSQIACNIHALNTAERQEHSTATKRLLAAVTLRRELKNGYVFELDKTRITLTQVAELVENEKRCCPFFEFQIKLVRESGPLSLTLTGRNGVKQLIETVLLKLPLW